MIAAGGPTPLWYAARSTGYVSLILLTAIVALGIVISMRWSNRDWPRFVSQALHRNLSLLVLAFLLIHILTSVIDPFAGIAVLTTVAPFTGSYRSLWLGLGVVSMELLVALTVTSLLRQRIPFRLWRLVHWAAYACWPLAILHTLGTGSDVRPAWAVLLTAACVGVVLVALVWRLMGDEARGPLPVRAGALAVTVAATIAVVGFAVAGPLHSGWAKAAGTPSQLLALNSGEASPAVTPVTIPAGVTDQLSGTLISSSTGVLVEMTDARDASLRIVIAVSPGSSTGRLTITSSRNPVCAATASVAQHVIATCGSTRLDISLTAPTSGIVEGQMVTEAAP